jgi:homoserine O-acetyltransferase
MRHPPLAPGWIDRPHESRSIGDLPLESRDTIRDCRLVWVEHGRRDAQGGNTVLVCCAIGSTHHRLDFLIGADRALDPARFHIVAIDALGNGLSSSPSNSESQLNANFPNITIRDMVESQRRLLDTLGIARLRCVIGASMGGMQALQWAVSHPERVESVVAMTPMARSSRWSQLVNELSRRAMFEDAGFTRPRPRADAMRLWTALTQLVIPSTPAATEDLATSAADLLYHLSYLEQRFEAHGPDPFDWRCQTRAYDAHDVGTTPGFNGDTDAALRSIRAPTLVLAPPLDLYNPVECARAVAAQIPGARYVEIPSTRGHRAAAGVEDADARFLNRSIAEFLQD